MLKSLTRVLVAFVLACLAAGVTQVLFVRTPAAISAVAPDRLSDELSRVGMLMLLVSTQVALFAAPFALAALLIGEGLGIRNWIFYALTGIGIACAGFLTQYWGEPQHLTILNDYAVRAYLTTGLVGGFTYWAAGGRNAGTGLSRKIDV